MSSSSFDAVFTGGGAQFTSEHRSGASDALTLTLSPKLMEQAEQFRDALGLAKGQVFYVWTEHYQLPGGPVLPIPDHALPLIPRVWDVEGTGKDKQQ